MKIRTSGIDLCYTYFSMKSINSPFTALQFRDFKIYWWAMIISRIGSEMQVVAVNWHVYLLTGSAVSLGIIGLSRFIPVLFAAPFGGLIADRVDRKKIIITTSFLMIIITGSLSYLTYHGQVNQFIIYLVIGLISLCSALETPARQSTVPHLVPKKYFMNATSLTVIMWQSAVLIGPAIAGFIIAYFGVAPIYLFNACTFIAMIIAMLMITPLGQIKADSSIHYLQSIKEGLNFVRTTPMIYSTMLLDFFATFFASATVLLPIFALDILHVGPKGLGLLYAAPALGAIVAGLITSSIGHFKNQGKILIFAVCFFGLGTILFGLSKNFYFSLFFLTLIGMGDMISTVIRNTIRQMSTPDYLRGRMVSINMIFFMGGPQLGEAEAGFLAAAVGAPLSVVFGGVTTIVAVYFIIKLVPRLIRYQGDEIIT